MGVDKQPIALLSAHHLQCLLVISGLSSPANGSPTFPTRDSLHVQQQGQAREQAKPNR